MLSLSLSPCDDGDPDDLLVSGDPMPEATLLRKEQLNYLIAAIEELPERLRTVITEFFLLERPMAEIARTLGVGEPRVSQMRAEALVLLRGALHTALDPHLVPRNERPTPCVVRRRDEYFRAVADRHNVRSGRGAQLEISA